MGTRCICCGNMTIDDLVFADGSTRMGVLGGDAVYSSIGASIWGDPVTLCSVAGTDYPVADLHDAFGIDTACVVRRDGPSLRNWGLYEKDGSRQFVFRSSADRWDEYTPRAADVPSDRLAGAYFHCAPVPWELQLELLRHARASGAAFVSADPAYQFLQNISHQRLDELLSLVDAFLPSLQELREMYPAADPKVAVEDLATRHPNLRLIVVKLGADGSLVHELETGRTSRLPAYPASVVDPTGAGDSYCGGFLAGYRETGDAVQAAICGAVSASFVVETEGTLGLRGATRVRAMERRSEMEEMISAQT